MNIELTTKSSFVTFFGFEEHFWLECPLSLQILQDGRPFNLSWTTMGSDPIQSLAKQSIKLTFWLNLRESLLLNSRSRLLFDSSPSSERDLRPLPPLIFISSAECARSLCIVGVMLTHAKFLRRWRYKSLHMFPKASTFTRWLEEKARKITARRWPNFSACSLCSVSWIPFVNKFLFSTL